MLLEQELLNSFLSTFQLNLNLHPSTPNKNAAKISPPSLHPTLVHLNPRNRNFPPPHTPVTLSFANIPSLCVIAFQMYEQIRKDLQDLGATSKDEVRLDEERNQAELGAGESEGRLESRGQLEHNAPYNIITNNPFCTRFTHAQIDSCCMLDMKVYLSRVACDILPKTLTPRLLRASFQCTAMAIVSSCFTMGFRRKPSNL